MRQTQKEIILFNPYNPVNRYYCYFAEGVVEMQKDEVGQPTSVVLKLRADTKLQMKQLIPKPSLSMVLSCLELSHLTLMQMSLQLELWVYSPLSTCLTEYSFLIFKEN